MVAPYFFPRGGGLESYVYNLAGFLASGHRAEVAVACSRWDRGHRVVENLDGIKVYRLPHLFKVFTTPVHPFWTKALHDIAAEERPDVINGHLPVPVLADMAARVAHRRGVPFVLTCHGVLARSPATSLLSAIYFAGWGKATLAASNAVIANSPQTMGNFHPSLGGKFREKIVVIPPGVDSSLFRPSRKPAGAGRTILFVGQLYRSSAKGLDVLIRTLPTIIGRLADARLLVVGPGPDAPYRELAASLGVEGRVDFLGSFPQPELPRYYNMADVAVLPSCNPSEGFGMSLIEAQSCGTPVVGTNVGGIPYAVLDGRTGLLVPPRDTVRLAQAITTLLTDRDLARRLVENGLERVREEFSWDRIARRTMEVYSQVLENRAFSR